MFVLDANESCNDDHSQLTTPQETISQRADIKGTSVKFEGLALNCTVVLRHSLVNSLYSALRLIKRANCLLSFQVLT